MSRQAVTTAAVAAALVVVALLVYYLYPTTPVTPGDAPPQVTEAERGDDAREVIADLQEQGAAGYETAFSRAQEFREDGRFADAQLLHFFAARGGHGPSAFELATAYDPNYHDAGTSLLPNPDAFQAYKWYLEALEGGVGAASGRLDELRAWAEGEAQSGNVQAEQLLLQWN